MLVVLVTAVLAFLGRALVYRLLNVDKLAIDLAFLGVTLPCIAYRIVELVRIDLAIAIVSPNVSFRLSRERLTLFAT